MKQEKRLDRIEACLTPKEAVMVWLKEINRLPNVMEYIKYLRDLPEALQPITRISGQVESATREAMKGQLQKTIDAAVHRAVRDVCFLIKLHHQVNAYQMTEERVWSIVFAYLESNLRAITWQNSYLRLRSDMPAMYSCVIP